MDRPVTLAEYSSWLQMVCAEAAICSRASDQLTARIEKIATFKERLAHRLYGSRQRVDQLRQTIGELQKTVQPVRECLAATKAKLAKLDAEDARLREELAESEALIEAATSKAETGPDREMVRELKAEEAKLTAFKRKIAESVTADNVWEMLPNIMSEERLKKTILKMVDEENVPTKS